MLALWDIDGTLLRVEQGIGREMYVRSFRAIFSVDVQSVVATMSFAGRTDRGLVYDIADAVQVARASVDDVWREFAADMAVHARELITPETAHRLDGAVEVLHALLDHGTVCGLLTGNIDGIAQHKLAMAGVPDVFVAGAFGDDHADRRDLPPRALAAVTSATGQSFLASESLIIGDAIGDVTCAKAHDIACVAVTTGVHTTEELQAAGATLVIDTLAPGAATASRLRQVLGYL